uniref:NADH-ubiquinone oxidoreductase chain 6 n=1 Tax=Omoglymmius wukong TaxID=2983420 RepID=A0A977XUC8_9CARA|nr:NADH dehydrogenase subunit 6 [Omoglymmius wukong]UXW93696.1 NADH dehydrogenase subunit 6 [Omoglymmius wukong]
MYFMMLMNLNLSIIFLFMKHPMSMGLILLLETLLISLISGWFCYSYWYSFILFLIMIGGLLILFIYMTSLASNEKLSYKMTIFNMSMILIFINLIIMYMYMMYPLSQNFSSIFSNNLYNKTLNSLTLIYNKPTFYITMLMIIYLLITLISAIKIINLNYGPLRQKL